MNEQVLSLAAQAPTFAERVRATVLSWCASEPWFDEVMHAPGPHWHPDATEVFVVLEGAFELAVGPETFTLTRGEMCLIPPDAVHDPLGTAGTDLALLSIVSPNRKGLRSQMASTPASESPIRAPRARVEAGPLPSNHQLECAAFEVGRDDELSWDGRLGTDRVLVVVRGEVDVRVARLTGRLAAGAVTFVPARAAHGVAGRSAEPAVVLAVWASGADS